MKWLIRVCFRAKSAVLYWLNTRHPRLFEYARSMWWWAKHGVAKPLPLRGNQQSYATYRKSIEDQCEHPADTTREWAAEFFQVGQRIADWPRTADLALVAPMGSTWAEMAIHHFASALERCPEVMLVYCDIEYIATDGSLALKPFTLIDELSLRHAEAGPSCFAVRLGPNGLDKDRVHQLIGDPLEGLSRLIGESIGKVGHLPLPLCFVARPPRNHLTSLQPVRGLRDEKISLSVIVPTRDGGSVLAACISSILPSLKRLPGESEILIVDNQSSDPLTLAYLEQIRALPEVRVLVYDAPFNYAAINNWASSKAKGKQLLLLNDDVQALDDNWLEFMLGSLFEPRVGAVGARLTYPNGRIQHAGVALGLGGVAEHPGKGLDIFDTRLTRWDDGRIRSVSAVTGACLLTTKAIFEGVGGLDQTNLPVAFNDVDFCLKVSRRGWRIAYNPHARLIHHESVSRGPENTWAKQSRFANEVQYMKKAWAPVIADDPHYSPHLSLHAHDLSFRNPPSRDLRNLRAQTTSAGSCDE